MDAVRKIIENSTNPLSIELPKEYENRKLEVIVMPLEEINDNAGKKYDFSDIVGNLEWKGDSLKEQRNLRDEWE